MGTDGWRFAVRRKETSVTSAKETGAVAAEKPKLTREELIKRAAGHPGIHVPDPDAPPFEKIEPIETRGIPASQMLIADRR
jgi:hypothetical protein